jgi:hypothetical protein
MSPFLSRRDVTSLEPDLVANVAALAISIDFLKSDSSPRITDFSVNLVPLRRRKQFFFASLDGHADMLKQLRDELLAVRSRRLNFHQALKWLFSRFYGILE